MLELYAVAPFSQCVNVQQNGAPSHYKISGYNIRPVVDKQGLPGYDAIRPFCRVMWSSICVVGVSTTLTI